MRKIAVHRSPRYAQTRLRERYRGWPKREGCQEMVEWLVARGAHELLVSLSVMLQHRRRDFPT
jgi:hypothetical protein